MSIAFIRGGEAELYIDFVTFGADSENTSKHAVRVFSLALCNTTNQITKGSVCVSYGTDPASRREQLAGVTQEW